jgi:hypothetical protein
LVHPGHSAQRGRQYHYYHSGGLAAERSDLRRDGQLPASQPNTCTEPDTYTDPNANPNANAYTSTYAYTNAYSGAEPEPSLRP